jgi:hypothetical protein
VYRLIADSYCRSESQRVEGRQLHQSPHLQQKQTVTKERAMSRGGGYGAQYTDTAAFAALLNELRGPLTGVAAVRVFSFGHLTIMLCFVSSPLDSHHSLLRFICFNTFSCLTKPTIKIHLTSITSAFKPTFSLSKILCDQKFDAFPCVLFGRSR